MNTTDAVRIIKYIFAEYEEPSADLKLVWQDQLKQVPLCSGMTAARRMLQNQIYGKPKISDFMKIIREIYLETADPKILITASEAYSDENNSLTIAAKIITDRAVPKISGTMQFSSPEDLDRANQINDATRRKVFTENFLQLQKQAIKLIEAGQPASEVLIKITGDTKPQIENQQIKKLIAGVIKRIDEK